MIQIENMGRSPFGGYKTYRYKSDKGIVSLISPSWVSRNYWEIYCIEGELFEDVERFDSKTEAEDRITELLKVEEK